MGRKGAGIDPRRPARPGDGRLAAWFLALAVLAAGPATGGGPGGIGPAALQAQDRLPIEIEVGASREVLTRGEEDWEDYWIRATIRPAPRTHVYAGLRHTRRFGRDDQQIEAGGGAPLGEWWTLSAGTTWSPTHRVLPRWSASGRLHRRLPGGWGIFFGAGRSRYEVTGVNRQHAGVERYVGSFRFAYELGLHQVGDDRSGARHGVSGSWLYERGSFVSLGLGIGREATTVAPGEVRSVSYRAVSLSGVHWLDDRTGVTFVLAADRHGPFFSRSRAHVGVRRRL